MDVLALSQKQKFTAFLIVLSLGFIALGSFTFNRIKDVGNQYSASGDVATGSISIYQTQAKLLSLMSGLDNLTGDTVGNAKASLASIMVDIERDAKFLNQLGLGEQAQTLTQSAQQFQSAVLPWLGLLAELGFNVDDGKLGELKQLANTIEGKIEETGMVTINSDFQAMIKAQQNYLLQPNEQNLKLFNRAMAGFVNMSNTYAMLDLYEKEIEQFKATFMRVSELSSQLGAIEIEFLQSEQSMMEGIRLATDELKAISTEFETSARNSSEQIQWSVLIACAVLAIFTIAIFITMSTTLTKALKQTGDVLKGMEKGDLSQRIALSKNKNDEFNQLAETINLSCENLGDLVSGVQNSSQALAGDATELNGGLDRLMHSQSEVLGQTQLLASATEEVSVTTQEVSNSLEFVAEISQSSTQAAEEGGKIITSAIGSLEEVAEILTSAAGHINQLEEASSKVDSVMEIINGIAEQTNLLALNAAIEAARAG